MVVGDGSGEASSVEGASGGGDVSERSSGAVVELDVGPAPSGTIGAHAVSVRTMTKPTLNAFFQNWTRSELSFGDKVRQAVANNKIKAKRGSSCCGNHGQVGC